MTEDAKTLIKLMGMPIIEAPTEAEAQCAVMCRAGLVHAVVSEDMDTLTFGAPVFIRNMFQPESRKIPVNEVTLSKVLEGLELKMPEFIDRKSAYVCMWVL
jgi:flap endonuclease-1